MNSGDDNIGTLLQSPALLAPPHHFSRALRFPVNTSAPRWIRYLCRARPERRLEFLIKSPFNRAPSRQLPANSFMLLSYPIGITPSSLPRKLCAITSDELWVSPTVCASKMLFFQGRYTDATCRRQMAWKNIYLRQMLKYLSLALRQGDKLRLDIVERQCDSPSRHSNISIFSHLPEISYPRRFHNATRNP